MAQKAGFQTRDMVLSKTFSGIYWILSSNSRGVVQLFNAVQKHQKNVDEKVKEAGGSIRKRAKLVSTVSKKDFISVLRGMDGSTNEKSSTGKNSKAKQVRLI